MAVKVLHCVSIRCDVGMVSPDSIARSTSLWRVVWIADWGLCDCSNHPLSILRTAISRIDDIVSISGVCLPEVCLLRYVRE